MYITLYIFPHFLVPLVSVHVIIGYRCLSVVIRAPLIAFPYLCIVFCTKQLNSDDLSLVLTTSCDVN